MDWPVQHVPAPERVAAPAGLLEAVEADAARAIAIAKVSANRVRGLDQDCSHCRLCLSRGLSHY